jgi:hypothetical protein
MANGYMTDELARKVMANFSSRPAEPGREHGPREEEKTSFRSRSLDPGEEALLVERIHAASDVPSPLDAKTGVKTSERKAMTLRDLVEQRR